MPTLLAFYRGLTNDAQGRALEDLWAQSFDELEHSHDFIQWLFPNWRPSMLHPESPILDHHTVAEFRRDPELKRRLIKSAEVMLAFYGLKFDEVGGIRSIQRAESFVDRAQVWLTPYNHNYLRITRILNALCELGAAETAHALFHSLEAIYCSHSGVIGEHTFAYWREAAQCPRR